MTMNMDTTPIPYETNPTVRIGSPGNELDLNDADEQQDFDLIPPGTIAKVRMTIKQGGYNDPARGWTARYATRSESGAIYLKCKFTILGGEYNGRHVWSLIGLDSPKGPEWNRMGRAFMKGIINSAYGLAPDDVSPEAVAKRHISFPLLNGIAFFARIDVEKDKDRGEERNVIKFAVTKGHKGYPANGGMETHALHQGFIQNSPFADASVAGAPVDGTLHPWAR